MNNSLQEYLNFANKLADEANTISMEYFRTSLDVENKSDETPVTIADKNTELKLRSMIEKEYPNHGILGEEFDSINSDAEFIWVIDPIDGTKELINGSDEFTLNIALINKQKPILGAIYQPMKDSIFLGGTDLPPKKIIDEKTEFLSNKNNQICNVLISKSHSSEEEMDFCAKVMSKFKGSKVISMGSCFVGFVRELQTFILDLETFILGTLQLDTLF